MADAYALLIRMNVICGGLNRCGYFGLVSIVAPRLGDLIVTAIPALERPG